MAIDPDIQPHLDALTDRIVRVEARATQAEQDLADLRAEAARDPWPRSSKEAAMGTPDLLNGDEAVEILKITPRHLRSLVQQGLLPVVKVGRLNRYRRADLEEFIDRRTVNRQNAGNIEEFVAEQRAKRTQAGLETRISDDNVYQLLDGLLVARGGGRDG